MGFILDDDTSPQVVFITGVLLIALAAVGLIYVDTLKSIVLDFHSQKKVSDEFWANFQLRSNVFLFLFPFVTAAIGTNLISDVLTKKLHYQKPLTFWSIVTGAFELLKIIFGFIILPVVCLFIIPLIAIKCLKRHVPWFMVQVGRLNNRHLQLKLLKIDIIARNAAKSNTIIRIISKINSIRTDSPLRRLVRTN